MKDCRDYLLETSRRVSFEYTLLGNQILNAQACFHDREIYTNFMQSTTRFTPVISASSSFAAGVNDSVDHAIELAELLHKWGPGYHVNLIPFNPIEGSEYQRPYRKAVRCSKFSYTPLHSSRPLYLLF